MLSANLRRPSGTAARRLLLAIALLGGASSIGASAEEPTSNWNLSGSATLGAAYDSNATFRTDHRTVRLEGLDLATGSDFRPEDDGKIYASLFSFQGRAIPGIPSADFESVFFLFGSRQFDLHDVDFRAGEVNLGIRFRPFAEVPGFSIKPFLVGAASDSGSDASALQGGGGLQLAHALTRRLRLEASTSWRSRENQRRSAADFSVRSLAGSLRAVYRTDGGSHLSALIGARDSDSRSIGSDFSELRAGLTAGLPFDAPLGDSAQRWRATLSVMYLRSSYGRDPAVDPSVSRTDRVWNATLGLTIPLSEHWSMTVEAAHTKAKSSLPNFEFDNVRPQLSLSRLF